MRGEIEKMKEVQWKSRDQKGRKDKDGNWKFTFKLRTF